MAIEDGAALGVLFSNLRSKNEVEERLALFERLRLDRVSAMQVFSSVGQDEAEKIQDLAKPYVKGHLPGKLYANSPNKGLLTARLTQVMRRSTTILTLPQTYYEMLMRR
jgi:2-polyprenyl-6-methoxyphenol hydroxylase-like FAD-dependent oxidoreductase